MTLLLMALAGLLVLYVLSVLLLQRSVLFVGTSLPVPTDKPPTGTEVVQLGGEAPVEAWYLPPRTIAKAHPAILYAHGNSELIDHNGYDFDFIRERGVAVLLVEYPGYGRSKGSPSEDSVRQAMVAGYDWLAAREDIDSSRIVAMGRSLGGGAVCALTSKRQPAALLLLSTFTSLSDITPRFGVPGALVLDPFDNLSAIGAFEGPVFIAHGRSDKLIPIAHAEQLAAKAGIEVKVMPGGHNNASVPWPAIDSFLHKNEIFKPIGE